MTELIKDGTGRSYLLKIDEENRASVFADSREEIAHVSWTHGEAYSVGISDYLTLDNMDWHLAISLKNTNINKLLVIQYLYFGWNGGNTTGDKVLWIRDSGGFTLTGGYSTGYIQNLNFTSDNEADAEFYHWDGVTSGGMGYTGGAGVGTYCVMKGRYQLCLSSSVILGTNDYAGIEVKGEEIGNFSMGAVFYFKDRDAT